MTEPLAGVSSPQYVAPTSRPTTEITTLPSGLKVASENTPGPTAALGLYINSGSVYEQTHNAGASHLLEYLAFKSTQHRTHFRFTRELQNLGAHVLPSASREQMAYSIDVAKVGVPEALELLLDAALNPKLPAWEVEAAAKRLEADVRQFQDQDPHGRLLEGLHSVAYTGGLSNPLVAQEGASHRLSAEVIADFIASNYSAGRMVLVGAGVEHQELLSLAQPLLEGVRASVASPAPVSTYCGGDYRVAAPGGQTNTMLAFEYQGGWSDFEGSIAVTVLQFLLGGGGSFSSGGPGKGMHSRLYERILNHHGWVSHTAAFNSIYDTTGIVGVFTTTDGAHAEDAVNIVCKELQAVATGVTEAELSRAKKATVSAVLSNLESRAIVAEDIGRQILTYGNRKPVADFLKVVEKLSVKDMSALMGRLFKTPLTMASLGDVSRVPRYDAVAKRFN